MDEDEIATQIAMVALRVYENFVESLDDETESIKNLYGEAAGDMFMDWVREHFRDIDF
jgi:uncharacterized membrane protein YqhA